MESSEFKRRKLKELEKRLEESELEHIQLKKRLAKGRERRLALEAYVKKVEEAQKNWEIKLFGTTVSCEEEKIVNAALQIINTDK